MRRSITPSAEALEAADLCYLQNDEPCWYEPGTRVGGNFAKREPTAWNLFVRDYFDYAKVVQKSKKTVTRTSDERIPTGPSPRTPPSTINSRPIPRQDCLRDSSNTSESGFFGFISSVAKITGGLFIGVLSAALILRPRRR
ncbi:hypothetical protein GEMRC1_008871 [Eukaryota sp. GEM-RC1]